ncbi:heterodisulfide reductase-related iron-sulfur binding cluster [uncultured Nocardioides sp.]|uniref:(Fe-S)-binding protein n=1 Tax=uncultured Nocardioides sp. TaxID=198441 RepID=UPI00260DC0C5|nr:heterodisulfide reductase-related iron-sulfur binding cluster [uncultured Nocardioides sp.]
MLQIVAIVVSLAITVVGIALFVRAIQEILGVIRAGQPAMSRTDNPGARTVTLLKESLGHTRMLQWGVVGAAHWIVFVGFGLLFFTLLTAFGQLFDAHFALPLIGHFPPYEWASEAFTWLMTFAIIGFIAYRATRPKERVRGARGRFYKSTMWQGYFVEGVILGVGLCIITLRGLEYALFTTDDPELASPLHFPLTFWLGELFSGLSTSTLENLIYLVAMLKIVISFTWMIVLALNTTMGVAWHRFTAFFNIWFKRESSGRTALGAVKPLTNAGQRVSLDDIEELDEDASLGVGKIEDFSWKNILDFTSCTECGRCQSQCPAWNTEKPLNPKLIITQLRDHAYAQAPYLRAAEGDREALLAGSDTLTQEVERPLIGDEAAYGVIDPEALWSCTSCGACVQQCPVDIEHVDHIIDMRRHAILVENNFPAELNQLFKGMENKGNPWNQSPKARLDWAKGLDFDVPVVGEDIEDLDSVEWLFWVGCAGAYEDRAKKTTRAVAELLHMSGTTFGVLGNGETCTGDPARRAGNEFVFQGLATQNAETLTEAKAKKVVSTCAHCFNTLKNEYAEFGVELEVVHHTQLLNRLVREGKLTPVKDGAGAAKRSITYHDPCYIGRHNGVYSPPRELLQVLPGAKMAEMERNSERSFCCGAGGARMWMEENTGERINMNRTAEAVGTGADQIAVGCPFCRVMLSDGLTMMQSKGEAREEVEVLDVAQMLLASVKGQPATKALAGTTAKAANTPAPAARADEATRDEPAPDDDTQSAGTITETSDAGPLAKASGGTSLFDDPAPAEKTPTSSQGDAPAEEAKAATPASSGGSLFDVAAPAEAEPEPEPEPEPAATAEPAPSSGGSMFDIPAPTEPEPAAEKAAEKAAEEPAESAGFGGSMFDIPAPAEPEPEPAAKAEPEPAAEEPAEEPAEESAEPAGFSGGSLFDIAAPAEPEPTAKAEPEPEPEPEPLPKAEKPAEPVDFSGGSLFDIPAPTAEAEAVAEEQESVDPEPTAPSGDEVSQAATALTADADPEPEPEPESEPEPEKKPSSNGEANQPKTNVDLGGSLFDI